MKASFAWFHYETCPAVLEEIPDFFAVSQSLHCAPGSAAAAGKQAAESFFFFFFFFMYLAKNHRFNKFGLDALAEIRVLFH